MRSSGSSRISNKALEEAELRQETIFVGLFAALASVLALAYCFPRGMLLLYGDAVAHLHIARRLTDSLNPGIRQLGSVWLPLPHIIMAPFAARLSWWQNGIAGAIPSMCFYVLSVAGLYRLARLWLPPMAAVIAPLYFGLNPGLLYMQTTAMTEPLYLAEMIWSILLLIEAGRALEEKEYARAGRLLAGTGLLLVAAIFTRYDGWILACLEWCIALGFVWRARAWKTRAGGALVLLTAMLAAAPAMWFLWNARQFGDWLDFMRGPYSAKAIDLRTSPPGSHHYPGWHNYWWSWLYYLKAAELGVASFLWTDVVCGAAAAGSVVALWWWRGRRVAAAVILLWMPVPFYAYSVAYGSVPIFIPPWPPHSYYNTRYGMEMLPCFALFTAFAVAGAMRWMEKKRPALAPLAAMVAICAILIDCSAQIRATPLVLAEAEANSRTRIPFELAYAKALQQLPSYGKILAWTSDHIGAFERAGIPLRRTINETDYYQWQPALRDPARAAPFVIATDGDAVSKAIAAHPGDLTSLEVVCSTGQPCVHIYRSTLVGLDGSITKK